MSGGEVVPIGATQRKRKTKQTVSWDSVQPLFRQLRATHDLRNDQMIPVMAGYSTGALSQWKTNGKVPKTFELALVGLLSQHKVYPEHKPAVDKPLTGLDKELLVELLAERLATQPKQAPHTTLVLQKITKL